MSKPKHSSKSPRPARAKKTRPASPKPSKAGRRETNATPVPPARAGTKQATLIDLMRRPGGATIADLVKATGWQPHSVRGAISGTLKKKLGLVVTSEKTEGRGLIYRVAATEQ